MSEEDKFPVRANPIRMRAAKQAASTYADAGIEFVPVPVLSSEHRRSLVNRSMAALDILESRAAKRDE